jgi:two-component system sensor histidine kinase KdpD
VTAQLQWAADGPSLVRRWITPITFSAGLLVLTTAVLWMVETRLKQDHLIFIYFVPTALIAIRYGSVSAMGVAIAGAFAGAFLLYPPRFSFAVDNPLDLMELILFSLLALLASQVVSGFANDSEVARRRVRPRGRPFPGQLRWSSGRSERAASPDQNV